MGGLVRLADAEERELEHISPQGNWRRSEAMEAAYGQVKELTYDKLLASVKVVRDMILYAIQDYRGQRARLPLPEGQGPAEEQAARSEQERNVRRQERAALWQHEGPDQFFFVMNLITQLAYQEGADRTGAVALDFSDIIRYTSDSERKLSTLREELNLSLIHISEPTRR